MYTQQSYTGQMPTQGWGHATINCATLVASKANAERVYLIHHSPTRSDDDLLKLESEARAHHPGAFAARDGLTIDLLAEFPA